MLVAAKIKDPASSSSSRKNLPRLTPAVQLNTTTKRPPRTPVAIASVRALETQVATQEKTIEDLRYMVGLLRHLLDGGEFALAQAAARSAAQGKLPSRM